MQHYADPSSMPQPTWTISRVEDVPFVQVGQGMQRGKRITVISPYVDSFVVDVPLSQYNETTVRQLIQAQYEKEVAVKNLQGEVQA